MHDDRGYDGGSHTSGFAHGGFPQQARQQPPPRVEPKPQQAQQAPVEYKRWEYEDPDGNIQGPFYASQILTWFR